MTVPESSPITFRVAAADDALCLGVLSTQVFLDTYAPHGIRAVLAREVLAKHSVAECWQSTRLPSTRHCWPIRP